MGIGILSRCTTVLSTTTQSSQSVEHAQQYQPHQAKKDDCRTAATRTAGQEAADHDREVTALTA
jgi:hypothetical protein